jgi:predicted transcriptional regulator
MPEGLASGWSLRRVIVQKALQKTFRCGMIKKKGEQDIAEIITISENK